MLGTARLPCGVHCAKMLSPKKASRAKSCAIVGAIPSVSLFPTSTASTLRRFSLSIDSDGSGGIEVCLGLRSSMRWRLHKGTWCWRSWWCWNGRGQWSYRLWLITPRANRCSRWDSKLEQMGTCSRPLVER